jgi:hypothetical protein
MKAQAALVLVRVVDPPSATDGEERGEGDRQTLAGGKRQEKRRKVVQQPETTEARSRKIVGEGREGEGRRRRTEIAP